MMASYFYTILAGISVFSAFLIFFKYRSFRAARSFALILLLFALECSFSAFMEAKGYRTYPWLLGLSRPIIFLYGPLFYLTFSFITGYNRQFRADMTFHFIPFAAHAFLIIPFAVKSGATKIFLYEHYVKGVAYIEYLPHFMMFMKVLFFSIYALAPIVLILKHRRAMMEFYSTIDMVKILKLAAFAIQYVFTAIFLIYIFIGYLTGPAFLRPDIPVYFVYILGVPIFMMVFFGLTDDGFFKCQVSTADLLDDMDDEKEEDDESEEDEKYKKNKIPDELAGRGLEMLKEVMENEKPFTDSNLTLVNLSEMVHMKPHHLSQILNGIIGENFYVYINTARIKYAAQLMKEDSSKDKSILEIAYQSGFNSKSAFNTYFKNIMGETPSRFRRKHK